MEPVKIQHSQVESPIFSSIPEKDDDDSKPSTSETSREDAVSPSAKKSPRLTPKPGKRQDYRPGVSNVRRAK